MRPRRRNPVLIELKDDLPASFPRDRLLFVDHHGERAGEDRQTSLEQVFELLDLPREDWTRILNSSRPMTAGTLPPLNAPGY